MIDFFLSDDEVYTFQWEQYLRNTGTVAAPPDLFKKVSILNKNRRNNVMSCSPQITN